MNLDYFEALVASSMFEKLSKETQELLACIMLTPMETASVGEVMVVEGDTLEITSVEVPKQVPKSLRSPMLRCTPPKEGPKRKKDKQEATQSVCDSLRKHQQKENPTAHKKGMVVDLEPREDIENVSMGM